MEALLKIGLAQLVLQGTLCEHCASAQVVRDSSMSNLTNLADTSLFTSLQDKDLIKVNFDNSVIEGKQIKATRKN